jgi:hypothetical protein
MLLPTLCVRDQVCESNELERRKGWGTHGSDKISGFSCCTSEVTSAAEAGNESSFTAGLKAAPPRRTQKASLDLAQPR